MDEITYELCGACSNEVMIDANNPSDCPECGAEILPCSTCPSWDSQEDFYCNWQEKSGCWRFPVIIPT
jgi:predicted RNA-binding Zn-ribbon protein involved in translation (DUF1610 family)